MGTGQRPTSLLVVCAAIAIACGAFASTSAATATRTISWTSDGTIATVGKLRINRVYWGPKGKTLFKRFGRQVSKDFDRKSRSCTLHWLRLGIYTSLGANYYIRRPSCNNLVADRLTMKNTPQTTWALTNGLAIGESVDRVNALFPESAATRTFVDADYSGQVHSQCLVKFVHPPSSLVGDSTIETCTLAAYLVTPGDGTAEYISDFEVRFVSPLGD